MLTGRETRRESAQPLETWRFTPLTYLAWIGLLPRCSRSNTALSVKLMMATVLPIKVAIAVKMAMTGITMDGEDGLLAFQKSWSGNSWAGHKVERDSGHRNLFLLINRKMSPFILKLIIADQGFCLKKQHRLSLGSSLWEMCLCLQIVDRHWLNCPRL